MAAEKTTKRKRRAATSEEGGDKTLIRLRTDPRREQRYEPTSSAAALVSALCLAIGSVLLGAGVYAQWLRTTLRPELTDPHPYAPYLLLGGALVLAAVFLFGARAAKPIRVGDAGIAVEKNPGELDRIEWRDVTRILVTGGVMTFQSPGSVIAFPLKQHARAAARAVAEARARIPGKLTGVDTSAVAQVEDGAGELIPLEAPQLAGARCKASDELIAFEKDARLCGQCGEVYHKAHVPERCLTCEAKLR
jgi:hypothetical protein